MTQSNARDAILTRIRSSIQRSRHGYNSEIAEPQRAYRTKGEMNPADRDQLFIERLHEYDARVVTTDPQNLAACISSVMAAADADSAFSNASSQWVIADGLPAAWFTEATSYIREESASIEDLNLCSGVVTTCTAGIAMTGSIVLQHSSGEGRRQTTLLPNRHLCIIQTSQIVETVPEAFERLAHSSTRPLTFISGPSATADIEMTRIRGVHGPRILDVVIVNGEIRPPG